MSPKASARTEWWRLDIPELATIGLKVRDGIVISVPIEKDSWLLRCPLDALADFAARRGWTLERVAPIAGAFVDNLPLVLAGEACPDETTTECDIAQSTPSSW